jgi:mRNA (guanine-N7-)-methyltransferase
VDQIKAYMLQKGITGFELLSCQFAMHYFFKSRDTLQLLFTRFSQFIRKGGYFMGTCVDGAKIKGLLGKSQDYTSDILRIHKLKAANSLYGSAYTFEILDQFDKGNCQLGDQFVINSQL